MFALLALGGDMGCAGGPHLGWNDFRFFGRQPENGYSGRNYLSGIAS